MDESRERGTRVEGREEQRPRRRARGPSGLRREEWAG